MRTLAAVSLVVALVGACGGDGGDTPAPIVFGGARPVQLQVPSQLTDGQRYPLLLVLHGYGAGGFVQQVFLGLGNVADTGVFVLAPDGTADSTGHAFWNADPACCDFDRTGVDDVAYLGGLIDDVSAAWPIDPARVWVVGHSNGAFMAYRLACDRADVVTAIGGLAGGAASTASSCRPSQPVGILHIHGTADGEVPYDGGAIAGGGVVVPGAVASVAQWAVHDGCTGALVETGHKDLDTSQDGAETTVSSTAGCPASGAADLWSIAGAGHLPALTDSFHTELLAWLAAHPR